jgi:hypothetical protein
MRLSALAALHRDREQFDTYQSAAILLLNYYGEHFEIVQYILECCLQTLET